MMTGKERMMTAMRGGIPDRVPCSPDTNWMIPTKMTGKPFWEVFLDQKPPLWQAYNACVRHLGIDGFSHHGRCEIPPHPDTETRSEIVESTPEQKIVKTTFRCPAGEISKKTIYLKDEAPTDIEKYVKDFDTEIACLKYAMFGDVSRIKFDLYQQIRADMGNHGVVGLCLLLPHLLTAHRQPTEAAFYDYYDHHREVGEFMEYWTDHLVQVARAIIDQNVKPDFVFFPNSGLITLQSVEIMKEFSIPALKKLTAMFRKAGILTSLHSCGKERALVEIAATETDLNCIDPLEIPPMGDCDLREIKAKFGAKIALKGNLHTSQVMLMMTPERIGEVAKETLEIGMPGGGFILATGDQCGRDTPEANIRKLVEVCEKHGRY